MAARQKTPSSPKVLRIEAMPLDFGEAAVVIELDAEPPKRWFKALKREMTYSEGLETASAKFDGCFVYLVGWIRPWGALSAVPAGCLQRCRRVLNRKALVFPTATRPLTMLCIRLLPGKCRSQREAK